MKKKREAIQKILGKIETPDWLSIKPNEENTFESKARKMVMRSEFKEKSDKFVRDHLDHVPEIQIANEELDMKQKEKVILLDQLGKTRIEQENIERNILVFQFELEKMEQQSKEMKTKISNLKSEFEQ